MERDRGEEWKTINQPPDWHFEPILFPDMPFHGPAFLSVLQHIDFLLRALPCGKHQLKELAPLLEIQNHGIDRVEYAWSKGESTVIFDVLQAVLAENPFHLRALCVLATVPASQGNTQQAESVAAWARRINPTHPRVKMLG